MILSGVNVPHPLDNRETDKSKENRAFLIGFTSYTSKNRRQNPIKVKEGKTSSYLEKALCIKRRKV